MRRHTLQLSDVSHSATISLSLLSGVRIYNTHGSFAQRKRNWHVITVMKINILNSKIYSKQNKIITALTIWCYCHGEQLCSRVLAVLQMSPSYASNEGLVRSFLNCI